MRVLLINKYFFVKGGSETYFFGLRELLHKNGHELIEISMKDKRNIYSSYSDYFVENIDYSDKSCFKKLVNGLKAIYSREAYKKLLKLIKVSQPDIAHVNLFCHQLTPSIFHALKKSNIPVVYTSHDYKIICPNYKLFTKGSVCQKCLPGKYYNCVLNKCHKNSLMGSIIVTIETYLHQLLNSYNLPDYIICPSRFMYKLFVKSGIKEEKIIRLHNFLSESIYKEKDRYAGLERENTILYIGRLSEEKGLYCLLDAKKNLSADVKLKIIGTGPEQQRLREKVRNDCIQNVEFLGFMSGDNLYKEMACSKCTVIPSVCYEIFGLAVIESFAFGTPVIGSRIGGIPELIQEGINGYLFEANNSDELCGKIRLLLSLSSRDYSDMANNCRRSAESYSPERFYNALLDIYKDALKIKNNQGG
ncbi:MAG: glycosyltransferase [Acetivibrionales bacterium]